MRSPFKISKEHGYPLWGILLLILVIAMLAIIVVTTINGKKLEKRQVQDALVASNKIYAALAVTALEPIISEDIAGLETIIEQILQQVPEIQSISVSNEEKITLIKRMRSSYKKSEHTKTFLKNIQFEGEIFGDITIVWDIGEKIKEIKENAWYHWLSICIPLLVLSIFFVVSSHFLIVRPLTRMRNRILAVQNGDLSTETNIKGSREIQLLQTTVNRLCRILKTEQHQKEELLLAKKNAEHELYLRQRTEKEREKLQAELLQSQKMESIGILAGGIAHEFNNVLSIILGNNELLMHDLPDSSSQHENTEKIQQASLRARDVVKQLLTFSHQDSSIKTLIKTRSVISDAIKLIRVTIPANIKIEQKLDEDVHAILASAT